MNACCKTAVYALEPLEARPGSFQEVRACPKCGARYILIFECGELDDELVCSVTGARPVEKR
jgi:hypothetical protein